ncbi:MAG: GNAT family N-acetyltransferase [Pseudomonadota bacterium]
MTADPPGPAPTTPSWSLRRAVAADYDAIVLIQRAAYAANRERLGVEPLPLLLDYRDVLETLEVWIAGVPAEPGVRAEQRLSRARPHGVEFEGECDPAGVLIIDARADTFTIESIAIHPAHQGCRLGASLLAAGELRARALGFKHVLLYTGRPLTHLIDWYQRAGYAIDRIEPLADREIVHLRKSLT